MMPQMAMARAPLRVSFVGGGSDLPWKAGTEQGGATISTSINKYVYVVAKWREANNFVLHWKEREEVDHVSELKHNLVRMTLKHCGIWEGLQPGLEIITFADIPGVGSGLGSSSATIAALLRAIWALKGIDPSPEVLAETVSHIEIDLLQRKGGKQDQYVTSIGGMLYIDYLDGKVMNCRRIDIGEAARYFLADHFALFAPRDNTGRDADSVLVGQKNTYGFRKKCIDLCSLFEKALIKHDWAKLAACVGTHHILKRDEFNGKTPYMKADLEEKLQAFVPHRFKLCGAGATGYLLVGTTPEERPRFDLAMEKTWGKRMQWLPTTTGAEVIYAQ